MKQIKTGLLIVIALLVVTLVTLRVTGLEPRYIDPGLLRLQRAIEPLVLACGSLAK